MNEDHISRLLEDVSTPETSSVSDSNDDPFQDHDGEFDSDEDYRPSASSESTDEEIDCSIISGRRRHRYSSSGSNDSNAQVSPSLLRSDDVTAINLMCQSAEAPPAKRLDYPHIQSAEDPPPERPDDLATEESPERLGDSALQPAQPLSAEQLGDPAIPEPVAQDLTQLQNEEGWSKTTIPITDFNFDESSVGPKFDVNLIHSPLDMFKLVFPESLIEHMVNCTNKYGENLVNQNGPRTRNSRHRSFRPVDRQEIISVLGLCFLQGQIKFPVRRNCFSNDPLYYHPFFQYVISGRRFEQIIRCLCVADDQARGEHKVLDFIKALNTNFRHIYSPPKELSIDESLILIM